MESLNDFRVLLAYGDIHRPNHDEKAVGSLMKLIRDVKPDIVIDGGDMISATCLSGFRKGAGDLTGLQAELDADFEWRSEINSIVPNAEKVILRDNHFWRRLEDSKKDIHWAEDLKSLQPEALLRLGECKWTLTRSWKWHNILMFIHGDEKGGYMSSCDNPVNKVRRMVKSSKISIVRFHSHTTGIEMHRAHTGHPYFALQLGTFEDPDKAGYIEQPDMSNWTTSAAIFYLHKNLPLFIPVPIFFIEGMTIFNGKLYR